MTESEICNSLAEVEKYLSECKGNAATGSRAEQRFESWRQAVNAARAWIIARMTEEDD